MFLRTVASVADAGGPHAVSFPSVRPSCPTHIPVDYYNYYYFISLQVVDVVREFFVISDVLIQRL